MLDFCTLDIPYCTLLQGFSTLIEPLKRLCSDPHKVTKDTGTIQYGENKQNFKKDTENRGNSIGEHLKGAGKLLKAWDVS